MGGAAGAAAELLLGILLERLLDQLLGLLPLETLGPAAAARETSSSAIRRAQIYNT